MNSCNIMNNFCNFSNEIVLNNKYILFNKICKLCEQFITYNNLNLVNLHKLDNLNDINNYYWTLCINTNYIFIIKIIENNNDYIINDIKSKLTEINKYIYTELYIYINDINNINKIKIISKTINDIIINNENINDIKSINKKLHILNFDSNIQPYKKRRITSKKKDWNDMISASSTRNYLLNDPLLDYLQISKINPDIILDKNIEFFNNSTLSYSKNKTIINKKNTSNPDDITFNKYILNAGIEFENELIKILKKKHKIIKVAESYHSKDVSKFNETINLMKKGIPIIYQGVLHNYNNKTYGLPDLLVKSTYINKLFNYQVITNEEANIPSPKLNLKYHYKVIDIKHSTIYLKADGIHILNNESIPAYKGQLYIYTCALNNILGVNINKAFIWGKKYKTYKTEYLNFLNKVGLIDYDNNDKEYINLTNKAIEWIKTIKKESFNWSLLPLPCRYELFPNMKNEKDDNYRNFKNKLNNYIKDITSIWYCGVQKREIAHSNLIFSWNDLNCIAKNIGFNNSNKISITIDNILNINKSNNNIFLPLKVEYDRDNWITQDDNILELFIDYETLNSNFGSIIKDGIIKYHNNQYIFMIGIGYYYNNEWIFKTFIMNNKTYQAEVEMFNNFNNYILNLLTLYNKKHAKFYHWSYAEPIAYNKFKNRNLIKYDDSFFTFYDLYKIFISEPVVINGALNYSLKSIAKALKKHNLINSIWDTNNPCCNGLTAMILANKLYDDNNFYDLYNEPIMKDIIHYNEIDCKVLYEILYFLRTNL